jgi:hypothetical protein
MFSKLPLFRAKDIFKNVGPEPVLQKVQRYSEQFTGTFFQRIHPVKFFFSSHDDDGCPLRHAMQR